MIVVVEKWRILKGPFYIRDRAREGEREKQYYYIFLYSDPKEDACIYKLWFHTDRCVTGEKEKKPASTTICCCY